MSGSGWEAQYARQAQSTQAILLSRFASRYGLHAVAHTVIHGGDSARSTVDCRPA
jgi:hypothetical protein